MLSKVEGCMIVKRTIPIFDFVSSCIGQDMVSDLNMILKPSSEYVPEVLGESVEIWMRSYFVCRLNIRKGCLRGSWHKIRSP